MGNHLCQHGDPQQDELLHYNLFDTDFKRLIQELLGSVKDDDEMRHQIKVFSLKWDIPLEGAPNMLKHYQISQVPIIPFEGFRRETVVNVRICLDMDEFKESRKILDKILQRIKEATPLMIELSASQDPLEQDTYHIISPFFTSSVLNIRASSDLMAITTKVMKQRNEGQKNFYYREVQSDEVLKGSIQSIKAMLDGLKANPEKMNILSSYYILDVSATQNILNLDDPNLLNQLVSHILEIIPKKFLIFDPNAIVGTDGLTLYSGTICLRGSLIDDSVLVLAQAKCVVTILHQISYWKRVLLYSEGKFYLRTPQKLSFVEVGREAGNSSEQCLFGGVLSLNKLTENQAEEILRPENYSSLKKLEELKAVLVSSLTSDLRNTMARDDIHDDNSYKCGMFALSYITAFKD